MRISQLASSKDSPQESSDRQNLLATRSLRLKIQVSHPQLLASAHRNSQKSICRWCYLPTWLNTWDHRFNLWDNQTLRRLKNLKLLNLQQAQVANVRKSVLSTCISSWSNNIIRDRQRRELQPIFSIQETKEWFKLTTTLWESQSALNLARSLHWIHYKK